MVKTSVPSRVLSVALAAALCCTMMPAQGIAYAAETDDAITQNAAEDPAVEPRSADPASAEAAADGSSAAADSADQASAEPVSEDSAAARVSEDLPVAQSAAAADGAASANADIEITRTSVTLSAQAAMVFSHNGLVFRVNADDPDTVACIGWTDRAPEGDLQIPEQAIAAGKAYPVTRIMTGGGSELGSENPADPENAATADAVASAGAAEDAAARDPYATECFADADKAAGVISVHIPATVESIDPAFFQLFPNAASVEVDPANSAFTSLNGMLFSADLTILHLVPEGMEGVAVLPESLATVPAYVISRCKKLFGLTFLPSGSTGNSTFAAQDGVLYTSDKTTLVAAPAGLGASIAIAPECTAIAAGAFLGNEKLKTIIAMGKVAEIAAGSADAEPGNGGASGAAFEAAAIEGATVITDDRAAWEAAGFTHFASPAEPGDSVAPAPGDSGLTYTLMENGQLSVKWTGEAPASGKRNIPSAATLHGVDYTVSVIEDGAFEGQDELTEIVLPDTITTIGERAFAGCAALESAQLAGSVTSIGASAFEGCASLGALDLGSGLRTIGERAFAGTALAELVLPAGVQSIGASVFADCEQLVAIVAQSAIPDVSEAALADVSGVSIYAPYEQDDQYAWNIGPVASANHLLAYGVAPAQDIYELTVGDTVNALEGGLLEAAGDAAISVSYRGSAVSADATGAIAAKQLGTSTVTYAISYHDLTLAKATCTVIVDLPAGDSLQSEGGETKADADPDVPEIQEGIEVGVESAALEKEDDAQVSIADEQISDSETSAADEGATQADGLAEGVDLTTHDGIPMLSRTMSLSSARAASVTHVDLGNGKYRSTVTINPSDEIEIYIQCCASGLGSFPAGALGAPLSAIGGFFTGTIQWISDSKKSTPSGTDIVNVHLNQTNYNLTTSDEVAYWEEVYGEELVGFVNPSTGHTISSEALYEFKKGTRPLDLRFTGADWQHSINCGGEWGKRELPNLHICWTYAPYFNDINYNNRVIFDSATSDSVTWSNGGSGKTNSVIVGAELSFPITLPSLTRKGYKHVGWLPDVPLLSDTDVIAPGTSLSVNFSTNAISWPYLEFTFTAQWEKLDKITFNVNGGTGTAPSQVYAERGKLMPTINANKPTRTGYTFLGWYSNSGSNATGGTRYYDQDNKALTTWNGSSDTTLYAHWGYSFTVKYPVGFQWGVSEGTVLADCNYGVIEGSASSGAVTSPYEPVGLIRLSLDTLADDQNSVSLCYLASSNGLTVNWYARPQNGATLYALYKTDTPFPINANGGALGSVSATTGFITAPHADSSSVGNVWHFGMLSYSNGGSLSYLGTGDIMVADSLPVKTHYKLKGLSIENSTSSMVTDDEGNNTHFVTERLYYPSSTSLYAQWDYARYTIAYNKNDTDATGTISSHYAYWGTNPTIEQCTFGAPEGKRFTEWNTKADGTGTVVPGSTEKDTTYKGDLSTTNGGYVTLYAQWANNTYTISYNANGGTGSMSSSKATCNTTNTISRCTFTAPKGHSFNGWNTKADGSGTALSGSTTSTTAYTGNLTTTHEGSVTLYAQWKANVYTISLSNKDADENGTSVVYLKYDDGYYSNSACTDAAKITKIVAPTRVGYDFEGYEGLTNSKGEITAAADAFSENKTGTNALNPSWDAYTCTILFDANYTGSTYATESWTFTFDDLKNSPRLPKNPFERANHEFKEWNANAAGSGTVYTDEFQVNDTLAKAVAESDSHTMKLFAQWTQVAFNVTYESNGGSAVSSEYVGVGDLISDKMNPPASTRAGYTLEGWYESDVFEGDPWDFASDKMPRRDVKLYAKWSHNTFTVTFKAGRGTGDEQSRTYTYEALTSDGSPLEQLLPDFDRDLRFSCTGGTFKGWTLDEAPAADARFWPNRADVRTGLSYGEDVVLYAQWDPVSYYVFFDPNSPTDSTVAGNMPFQQLTYIFPGEISEQTLSANVYTCEGYEFMGWNTVRQPSDEEPGTWYEDGATVPNLSDVFGIVPLYAQWKGAPYTVHFEANVPAGEIVEGEMEDQELFWGLASNLNLNRFKRQGGWVFAGWNTLADGSGTPYADGALVRNLRPEEGQEMPTLYAQWDIAFDVDVPVVDHINVTMNPEGEWITVENTQIVMRSYSPLPVGVEGLGLAGASGLDEILADPSQASQLVLNVSSQGTTVPLSAGTTSTDSNCYFRLGKGSLGAPASLPIEVDLATRNPGIQLKEHAEPTTAFRLTFLLSVIQG